ncbi:MAG: SDR family NAD(P)-dependent oxidoreductase, partial [Actinomycetia bacterium]|nr:SDR family NAD(P)-dependent oxidoreductase [Actinomycetes bacterium]
VVICSRDESELGVATTLLREDGATVHPLVCDVDDADAVAQMVADVENELGPVEVAIHVAGIIQVQPLASASLQDFEDSVRTMLMGPVHLALAVLPGMRERRRGRIGTVASIGGAVSVPHLLPYSTAKFGAVGFARGLSAELVGTGVTSTAILPGLMRTGSHLNAQFGGDAAAEYAWFAPGASLPLVAMDAERAAERIVSGVLAGRNQVVLTPLAKIGMRVAGLAPSLTTTAMKALAAVLPNAPESSGPLVDGHTARDRLDSPVVERLTTLGTRAAKRLNQFHQKNSHGKAAS